MQENEKYMNEALEVYKDEKKVWHISGWNYQIDSDNLDLILMSCVKKSLKGSYIACESLRRPYNYS